MPRHKKPQNAITVQELRDMLQDFPDDMPVVFAYPSGDYWRTEVANQVKEVEEGSIEYSNYHQKFQVSEEGGEESIKAVILK